jgi:hypothetical protein
LEDFLTLVMRALLLVAVTIAIAGSDSVPKSSSSPIFELDVDRFYAALRSEEDALVSFVSSDHSVVVKPDILSALASQGSAIGIRVYSFDVGVFGVPGGVHIHDLPALVLFAPGRDPAAFDCAVHAGGGHGHGTVECPSATLSSVIGFLRKHGSFPALLPVPPSDPSDFGGRDVFGAIAEGLRVARQQMQALRAENAELKARLHACLGERSGGSCSVPR